LQSTPLDLKGVENKEARLLHEVAQKDNWPALVFVSSPDKANDMASLIALQNPTAGSGTELSEWMTQNYGERWELSEAVAAGIGVHHARIPRALASRFVTLFNKNVLPILICTSTLIEG
jgi:replicative superfamily II helicase